jgi:hypothetical protein
MGERTRAGAVALAGALLVGVMSGCSGGGDPVQPGGSAGSSPTMPSPATPSPPTPTGSATATPDDGLTPEERVAFEEATEVVLAYRQTIADLYSGARTDLNDLDKVATGDLLDQNLRGVQQGLAAGRRSLPVGARLALVEANPVTVDLTSNPSGIRIRACIDSSRLTDLMEDGSQRVGTRESLDYWLVKTNYLPEPGWAVAQVKGKSDPKDRAC